MNREKIMKGMNKQKKIEKKKKMKAKCWVIDVY